MESSNSRSELPSPKPTIPIQPTISTHPVLPELPAIHPPLKISSRAFKQYINLQLIKSCVLIEKSRFERALKYVEEASFIAEDKKLFYEISKCSLYRGLCFMGMKRWKEARVALVRGVNVRGWCARVEELMREATRMIEEEGNVVKGQRKREVKIIDS